MIVTFTQERQSGQVRINIDYSSSWSGAPIFGEDGTRRGSLSRHLTTFILEVQFDDC